ncbi:MAG: hypothetical protein WAM46_06670, partial [Flavobacterium sp.]
NETLSTNQNVEKKQSLAVKIIKLLLKIIETFEGNIEPTDIEQRIYQIDAERVELKLKLT